MLRIVPLGSGSRGNATLIEAGSTRLLVDAGLFARTLAPRLEGLGVPPRSLAAILLSHEHHDHAAGAERFSMRHRVPVVCSAATLAALDRSPQHLAEWIALPEAAPLELGDFRVESFPLPHDAARPVGFVLRAAGLSVALATDLGHATTLVVERLRGAHALVVESNHDERMLRDRPYPWQLKQRVAGRLGHLSNDEGILRKLFFPLQVKVPIQALATVLIAFVAWNVYKTGEPEFRHMAPPSTAVQEAPQARIPQEPAPAAGTSKRDEIPATREKKTFAPPPEIAKEPASQRAETRREETTTADAEKPIERSRAAKRAVEAPKDNDAWKGAGEARTTQADRVREAQARDTRQKAVNAPAGPVAKETGKQEARPAAAPMMSSAATPQPDLEITLRARDPGSAAAPTAGLHWYSKTLGPKVGC